MRRRELGLEQGLKNWTVGWPGNEAKLLLFICFWLPLATTGAVSGMQSGKVEQLKEMED